ncbi:hypothetical protein [Nocardioides halotolerans]|jgi:hypothetical protein|uniref:hypothetical protein n=1 Tax=Nocardioides halotolerans TaxID=433660 RepID=UPI00041F73FA|nr:hypothetical protein [Nocardioides halotolerans]
MVEFVSWFGVAVIALFAVVGFTGVVATSVLTAVRALRHRDAPVEHVDVRHRIAA